MGLQTSTQRFQLHRDPSGTAGRIRDMQASYPAAITPVQILAEKRQGGDKEMGGLDAHPASPSLEVSPRVLGSKLEILVLSGIMPPRDGQITAHYFT